MQGRIDDAKRTLAKTSNTKTPNTKEEATLQLADIKKAAGIVQRRHYHEHQPDHLCMARSLHPTRSICHMLVCAIRIQFIQRVCGIDTKLLYIPSPLIFEKAITTASFKKLLMNMTINFVKIVCVLIAALCLDRVGRRPLLLSSIGEIIFSLVSFGMCLIVIEHSHTKHSWVVDICITTLFVYVASSPVGMGPITNVYTTQRSSTKVACAGVHMRCQGETDGANTVIANVPLMPETKDRTVVQKFNKWRSATNKLEMQWTGHTTKAANNEALPMYRTN